MFFFQIQLEGNVTHMKKKQKMDDRELPFSKDVDKEVSIINFFFLDKISLFID